MVYQTVNCQRIGVFVNLLRTCQSIIILVIDWCQFYTLNSVASTSLVTGVVEVEVGENGVVEDDIVVSVDVEVDLGALLHAPVTSKTIVIKIMVIL